MQQHVSTSKILHVIGMPLCCISVEVLLSGTTNHLKILEACCRHWKSIQGGQRDLAVVCYCTILLKKACCIILSLATAVFAQLFLCYFSLWSKMTENVKSWSSCQRFPLVESLLLALPQSRVPNVESVLDSTENIVMLPLQNLPASHARSISSILEPF